jgi:hypothetical protein
MFAKVVQAQIDPARVADAARAVEEELIPLFREHPGALHGYWMANRASGQVMAMTCWTDLDSLDASRASDGEERARVAERIGLRIQAIHTLAVLGVHEHDIGHMPVLRSARVTWVEGLAPDLEVSLRAMHRDVVDVEAQSPGFCGSYWLADRATGNGLEVSLWGDLAELRDNDHDGGRRRRWFEKTVGCRIDLVGEYEAIGVVAPATIDLIDRSPTNVR